MRVAMPKTIFLMTLAIMKKILDLGEFKLDDKSYKYFKKEIMDIVYKALKKLFKTLEQEKIIERCECKAKLRQGYSDCPKCGGSGYINKKI